jgi:hypothetical protein
MKILATALALFLAGCQTYTPQKIKYCGTFHLYTDRGKLDAEWHNSGGPENHREGLWPEGFYRSRDNSIHVMKWDFETMGHEVYHGLKREGLKTDGFIHFDR